MFVVQYFVGRYFLDFRGMTFRHFGDPGTGQVPRPLGLRSTLIFLDFGKVLAAELSPKFDAVLVPMTTCWQSRFVLFLWLSFFQIVVGFRLHLGRHLAWFLGYLWTLEIKLKRWRTS